MTGHVAQSEEERGELILPLLSSPRAPPPPQFQPFSLAIIAGTTLLSLHSPLVPLSPSDLLSPSRSSSFSPSLSKLLPWHERQSELMVASMAARARQSTSEVTEVGDPSPSTVQSPPLVAIQGAWGRPRMNDDEMPSLATFDGPPWCQKVPFSLLIVVVPSIRDESPQIVGTVFRTKRRNFNCWSELNRALFWGNDLVLLIGEKNNF